MSDRLAVVLNPQNCRTSTNRRSHENQPAEAELVDFVPRSTHAPPPRFTIPVPKSWASSSSPIADAFPGGEIPVPSKLACPFRMHPRDGKGSFEKKDPEEVIASGQWFLKNVPVDQTLRWVLGVE